MTSAHTYLVESLVGRRYQPETHDIEYKVRWSGYHATSDTWESVQSLRKDGLLDAILAFDLVLCYPLSFRTVPDASGSPQREYLLCCDASWLCGDAHTCPSRLRFMTNDELRRSARLNCANGGTVISSLRASLETLCDGSAKPCMWRSRFALVREFPDVVHWYEKRVLRVVHRAVEDCGPVLDPVEVAASLAHAVPTSDGVGVGADEHGDVFRTESIISGPLREHFRERFRRIGPAFQARIPTLE